MNKKYLLLPAALIALYVSLASYSSGPASAISYDGTGARASTAGCNCHGSAATSSTSVTITLDSAGTPVTRYVAGQYYTITITGTQTSSSLSLPKFGFQLSAVFASGSGSSSATNAGTLATSGLPTGCANRTMGSYHLIEHTTRLNPVSGTGGAGTIYRETIGWVAPSSGGGPVKLFGVINAINNSGGGDAGDKWNTANATFAEENAPITGPASVCSGSTITLTCNTPGGTWSSGSPAIASVSATGDVTGISSGSAAISYTTSLGTSVVNVGVIPTPTGGTIIGSPTVCIGAATTLSDSGGTPGGNWSSGATSIASINIGTGFARGLSAGTAPITYSITNSCGSAQATGTLTVIPLPTVAAITGTSTLCESATTTLADATTGGTWGSSAPGIASVNSAGTVIGIAAGSATLSYSVSNTCGTTSQVTGVTVNPLPHAGSISGPAVACLGAGAFSLTTSGSSGTGSWSTSAASVASINSSGMVTPVSLGTATITYVAANGCGTNATTRAINVSNMAFAGTISAATTNVCLGSSITLTDSIAGGTWATSNALATVTAGIVTGIGLGSSTISYTVTNACGTAVTTKAVTINPLPFAGTISVPALLCVGASLPITATGTGGALSITNAHASLTGTVITGVSAGQDTIVYTTANSCGTAIAHKPLNVNPLPFAGTITGINNACPGKTVALANATPGGTWASSTPSVCGVSATGIVNTLSPGFSSISYSVGNTCGNALVSLAFTVNDCYAAVGNLAPAVTGGLQVFPNPNNGAFTINLPATTTEPAQVSITNVLGEKVSEFNITTNVEVEQSLQLPAGIYFVSAITKNERLVSKVIIGQ